MDTDNPDDNHRSIQQPKPIHWLQRLKEESWEAELLVSAIAVFGTYQLFDFVDWAINTFIDRLPPDQYTIGYFIAFSGLLAVSILVSMFIIHFFLRAYWIGLVGLNSVFPDYGLEDSAYSKIYTEKILALLPTLEETISRVDELCSVIFSAAFTLLLIYAYIGLTSSIYLTVYNLLSDIVPYYILLIPIMIMAGIIVLQGILSIVANLKMFKTNRRIQLLGFHVTKIQSKITYGPLYKSILQVTMTFGSNFKKKKSLIGLIVIFLFCGILMTTFSALDSNLFYLHTPKPFYEDQTYATYYQDQNTETTFLLAPEIESDVFSGNYMKLFIPIFKNEKSYQNEICGAFEENEELSEMDNRLKSREHYLNCYYLYHKIYLNGKELNVDYIKKDHAKTDQFGIVAYIENTEFVKGRNVLKVEKTFGEYKNRQWSIPFYFVPSTVK